MFKKLIPVIALALIAGPAFAARHHHPGEPVDHDRLEEPTISTKQHQQEARPRQACRRRYVDRSREVTATSAEHLTQPRPVRAGLFAPARGLTRRTSRRACGLAETGSNLCPWMGRNRPQYIRRWFPYNMPSRA